MVDFENLGEFYLGRVIDEATSEVGQMPLLYDARDLTTHAVCVGMTGSGKTGLCISLLEEAAIDRVPALAIDPKGDLGNLLLTFPNLRPADFAPWIDPGEAARRGKSVDDYAAEVAATWAKGLGDWGQDGDRIGRFRQSVDLTLYTPGSTAGVPLSILGSFAAPPAAVLEDGDALRQRILAAVSGLLALLGIEADPLRSREHILLSTILDTAWRQGRDLDLAALIAQIQRPPFDKLGVLDLESFFSSDDRFELAIRLNNLLASPAFSAWTEGDPLDVGRLLYTSTGQPRLSILSIAHLSENERMFFVTLLLNEVVSWMRSQAGTPSLRAILYMDEIFGFFPPVKAPPSKGPMLTLLKQGRAYGLGIVLATQNPVDLDYKGLSNTGTWFIGRVQTERDKARLLDGLEGAATAGGQPPDRQRLDALLSGLGKRVFLMHDVHETGPVRFQTRWALSYLRGPLTLAQIRTLMAPRQMASAEPSREPAGEPGPLGAPAETPSAPRVTAPAEAPAAIPIVAPEISQRFLRARPWSGSNRDVVYAPGVTTVARLHFVYSSSGLDQWQTFRVVAALSEETSTPRWEAARFVDASAVPLDESPIEGARFAELPAAARREKSFGEWERSLEAFLYRTRTDTVWRCRPLKLVSEPDEDLRDFRLRVHQRAKEDRDERMEKLRRQLLPKLDRLQERIRTAEDRLERERAQYEDRKLQTAISMGSTVLGALFGRRVRSAGTVGRAATTARGVSRTARERGDIERAQQKVRDLEEQLRDMETELRDRLSEIREAFDPARFEPEEVAVRPRKSDVSVEPLELLWMPVGLASDGSARPLFDL